MRLSGRHVLPGKREEIFERLQDPALLKRAIPGCEMLSRTPDGGYDVRIQAGFGPIKGTFNGRVTLKDLVPPRSYSMEIRGDGSPGFMTCVSKVELEPMEGGDTTEIRYESEVQVGGLLASVGMRFVPGAARLLSEQFFVALEKALREESR
jgi:carbon monoxide dehydrogenase subunit G